MFEKLNKKTIALIAFFFGAGMLCTSVAIGLLLPLVIRCALAHPRIVLQALMGLCLLPAAWMLGRPVAKLLERR